ncbi:BLUF domain-containing protein [Brevundimonas sp. AAP58]|uniref:BLUF domain-containing protein n=1 Tax=Brevundimonas sp. AAP58 TaxID=1523422 RepID=UPI0006B89D79|nr:BLUF domain-containing protein [Brevundimonas sp. AAP58]
MLYRLIYAAETVGSTGASTLSLAQILGAATVNNRRDNITSAVMFHDGWCLQGIEGSRQDVDRLMRRIRDDRRLNNIRIVSDKPVAERRFPEPMGLCDDPCAMMKAIGLTNMAQITAYHADRIVELKQAA